MTQISTDVFMGSTHLLNLGNLWIHLNKKSWCSCRRADGEGHRGRQIDSHSIIVPFPRSSHPLNRARGLERGRPGLLKSRKGFPRCSGRDLQPLSWQRCFDTIGEPPPGRLGSRPWVSRFSVPPAPSALSSSPHEIGFQIAPGCGFFQRLHDSTRGSGQTEHSFSVCR
jgi:hypothetical protein